MGFLGTPKDMGPPKMVRGTHTIPISLGIVMGIVWEAYHKGVPLLGAPENPIDKVGSVVLGCADYRLHQLASNHWTAAWS